MAFVGWSTKQDITINSTYIDSTLTNVPIILTGDAFLSGFFSALNTDGSDLRFSYDSDGNSPIPRDIQHIDTVAEEIIVHIKVSVTASTDLTIYAWGGKSSAEEPAPRDVNGYQNVWNDVYGGKSYYGVCHFQKGSDSGTLFPSDTGFKAGFESTGNWTAVNNDGNITNSTTGQGALTGQDCWILGSGDNITNLEAIDSNSGNSTVAHYFEFWWYGTTTPNSNSPIFVGDFNRYLKWDSQGKLKFGDSGNASTNGYVTSQWNQLVMHRTSGGNVTFGLNGNTNGTTSTTQDIENMNRIFQDRNNSGTYTDYRLAWLRVFRGDTTPNLNHLGIQWESVDNSALFATAGTLTVVPNAITLDFTILDQDTNPIETANVYVDEDDALPHIVNDVTDVDGKVSGSYSGASVQAVLRVRKYGYKAFKTPLSLGEDNITQTVTMISDPQQV